MSTNFPNYLVKIDQGNRFSMNENWYQFFSRFFKSPDPDQAITVGVSPYIVTATALGSILIRGGTVSKIEYSRDGTNYYDLGVTTGLFPVATNDDLRVTFSVAPTIRFFAA